MSTSGDSADPGLKAAASRIYSGQKRDRNPTRWRLQRMLEDQRPGTVYWIDHYAVGTNDLDRWVAFHERVLGATTTPTRRPNPKNYFQQLSSPCLHGGFLQPVPLPP